MKKKGLQFNPTPECCDKKLGNDWPGILCTVCNTEYNADDITEIMLTISATGKKPNGIVSVRTR